MSDNIHPGNIVKEYINTYSKTIKEVAKDIRVSRQTIHRIVSGKSGISSDISLRLEKYFGNDAGFWIKLQNEYEIKKLLPRIEKQLNRIQPYETCTEID